MFRFSFLSRGAVSSQARGRIRSRIARHTRPLSVESLERRELFAIAPTAPITFGGELSDYGNAVAFDDSNNRYIAGAFAGVTDFDLGPGVVELTSNGNYDTFIAKYYADGSLAWVRGFGSEFQDGGSDWRHSVAVDGSGTVYVLTSFAGTVAFDDIILTSTGPSGQASWISNVVLRLDTAGNVEWAQSFGNATYAGGLALHTEISAPAASSVMVAGKFHGNQPFGGELLTATPDGRNRTASGASDGFISRLDAATGQFIWTRQTSGKGTEFFTDVAVDNGTGSVYLTGYVVGDAVVGSTNLTTKGVSVTVVAKADLSGQFGWARLVATGISEAWAVAVQDGNVAVAGAFNARYAYFDGIRITNVNGNQGGQDLFTTLLDANGNVVWAVGAGSTGIEGTRARLAADQLGNVFLAGFLGGPAQIGSDVLSAGHFVSQIDLSTGQFIKSWSMGTGANSHNIATDADGSLWVTGRFSGTVTFPDGTTVTSNGSSTDGFLLRFSNETALASQSFSSGAPMLLDAVSADELLANDKSTWARKSRTLVAV